MKGIKSIATSFNPIAGPIQSIIETATGRDCFTGEPVNRWVSGAGIGLTIVPYFGSVAKNAMKTERLFVKGADVTEGIVGNVITGLHAMV